MAKVSKYSVLFYSGEQGYQNNRAQITLADADGNSLAFVRFKDPGMPYELDTETDGIITMHLPSAMLPSILDAVRNEKTLSDREGVLVRQAEARGPRIGSGVPKTAPKSKPTLLAGGNPQIAKADADGPVQAYIAAMPGWKRDVGRRLDALIARTVPGVRKAVKWNSPLYGVEGQGWFLSFHCFTKYVKVAFFRGASLRPMPPGKSKQKDVRYLDIHEDEELDEAQLAAWVKHASQLPGECM